MTVGSGTVLLVGLDAVGEGAFSALLTQRGLQVQSVSTGCQAFAGFESQLPDLLVVAGTLPDMSVARLCQRLRVNAVTRSIPVLVLLEAPDAEQERLVLEQGADACLSRQADPAFLMFRVCGLLREMMKIHSPAPGEHSVSPALLLRRRREGCCGPGGAVGGMPRLCCRICCGGMEPRFL